MTLVRERPGTGGHGRFLRAARLLFHAALTLAFLNWTVGFLVQRVLSNQRDALDGLAEHELFRGQEWAGEYWREFRESNEFRYRPFTGWTRRDYDGRYIHVRDGLRRSYEPENEAAKVVVHAFGGSTMWGWGARDEFTIASHLARFAEGEGVPVEIHNYGEQAFVSWQNVLRLAELCADGNVPDVALFYEGANDCISKLEAPAFHRTHHMFNDWDARLTTSESGVPFEVKGFLHKNSFVHMVARAVRSRLTARSVEAGDSLDPARVQELANDVVATFSANVRFAQKLADAYGFRCFFFWQPMAYTRREPTEVEREHMDTKFAGLFPAVYRAATRELASSGPSIDLSARFDDEPGTVFMDFAHTSEGGNRTIARAILEHIGPTLRRLAESKQK